MIAVQDARHPPIEAIERKSAVLTPSSLPCIERMPTINLTQGCAHQCVYCYARAYPTYCGDQTVRLYANLPEKLADELSRKRRWPRWVYFCSSSDCFGPYAELQRVTYRAMKTLLEREIGVSFLTKGYIRRPFLKLFAEHADLVRGQVGMVSTDDEVVAMLEPGAATPRRRLENLRRLREVGVEVGARIDPMFPGVTDTTPQLRMLLQALQRCGVTQVSASYLFLREPIRRQLMSELAPPSLRNRVLAAYRDGKRIQHKATPEGQGVIALPAPRRREGYTRLRDLAGRYGIEVSICTCKNSDLGLTGTCNLDGPAGPRERQLLLFEA